MPSVLSYISTFASSPKQSERYLYEAIRLLSSQLSKSLERISQLENAPVIDTGGAKFAIKSIFLDDDKTVASPSEIAPAVLLYVVTHDNTANSYTLTWPDPPFSRFTQPYQGENLVTLFWAHKKTSNLILPAQGKFGGFPTP